MNIYDLIKMIPESSDDEALASIQSMQVRPPRSVRLTCHLSKKFFIIIAIDRKNTISINDVPCEMELFLSALKRTIYNEDEATSPFVVLKERITPLRVPPPDMDIPIWDEDTQSWYDAEY